MDEIFHVPQAQAYCHGNYSHWDPMITTLPGLYLTSVAFAKSLEAVLNTTGVDLHHVTRGKDICSTDVLRFHNVILCVVNFWILHQIVKIQHKHAAAKDPTRGKDSSNKSKDDAPTQSSPRDPHLLLLSLNLMTFPILFFFSFLYYTDMGAVCFVLLGYWLSLANRHMSSALAFLISVLYRQTNIVWAAFAAGTVFLRHIEKKSKPNGKSSISVFNLVWELTPYAVVGTGFIVFLLVNGSIVVGDKTHHEASLHLPQIFYFFLVLSFFSLAHILWPLRDFVSFLKTLLNPLIPLLLTFAGLFAVHYLTYEHQYLLADNRHYPFYVWKNIFRKYQYSRYMLIPLYSLAVIYWTRRLAQKQSFLWVTGLLLCIGLATVPQKLLEFRYFVLPYLFVRLHCPARSAFSLYVEFLTNSLVNFLTIYIFLASPFKWPNSNTWQRFMW